MKRAINGDILKHLWTQYLKGDFGLRRLKVKDLPKRLQISYNKNYLDYYAEELSRLIYNLFAPTQCEVDRFDNVSRYKLERFILNDFDQSKYRKMNKKELGSYIITWEGGVGECVYGKNLISDKILRIAVSFYYYSRFIE